MTAAGVVLLIDDNAAILASTARYLSSRKLSVICSDSPFGIPPLMNQHAPDVVVLDVMMPALSGDTIAAMLRTQKRTAAIIYYSAMQEDELYKLSKKTSNTSYVLKSDGNDALYRAICRVIEAKR
jgi:DNA-binding NarL/FixJ family response regulator